VALLACAGLSACGGCPTAEVAAPQPETAEAPSQPITELKPVSKSRLDEGFREPLGDQWVVWRHQVDPSKSVVTTSPEGLVLDLETYARAHDEVSVAAVAWKPAIDFLSGPQTITLSLDWLEDSNASYLTAGLAIVPEAVKLEGDPRDLSEVAHVTFVGAGAGANARREVLVQRHGQEIARDTEGWPEQGREGRPLSKVSLQLVVTDQMIRVEETGREPVSIASSVGFARGRLVLFVASHSNSMRRAVRFTQLRVD